MRLTDYFEDTIVINGITYNLDFTFDNVLRVYELQADDSVSNANKINLMFDNLVIDCDQELDFNVKAQAIEKILTELIAKDNMKEQHEQYPDQEAQQTTEKTHDFIQDADLIYASFLYDYNIDLFEQQGLMHWNKFIALFNNLSQKTVFKQVVKIRTDPLPKPNKHNMKERSNLIKAKQFYSLDKSNEAIENKVNSAFDDLARTFKAAAEKGR